MKRVFFIVLLILSVSSVYGRSDLDRVNDAIKYSGCPEYIIIENQHDNHFAPFPMDIRWGEVERKFESGWVYATFRYYAVKIRMSEESGSVIFTSTISDRSTTSLEIRDVDLIENAGEEQIFFIEVYAVYRRSWSWPNGGNRPSHSRFKSFYSDSSPPDPVTNLRLNTGPNGHHEGDYWVSQNSENPDDIFVSSDSLHLQWQLSGSDYGSGLGNQVVYLEKKYPWWWRPVPGFLPGYLASEIRSTSVNLNSVDLDGGTGEYRAYIKTVDNVQNSTPSSDLNYFYFTIDEDGPHGVGSVAGGSVAEWYRPGTTEGTYDLYLQWPASAGDIPYDGAGIQGYQILFYNGNIEVRRTEIFSIDTLEQDSNGYYSHMVFENVNNHLGGTKSAVIRVLDNLGNYTDSSRYTFHIPGDPGAGLSYQSINVDSNGYKVNLNISTYFNGERSLELRRIWESGDNMEYKSIATKSAAAWGNSPTLEDSVPSTWRHRSITYGLYESGEMVLESSLVELPNIPADVVLGFKNGDDLQFSYRYLQDTGSAPFRGAGTLSDGENERLFLTSDLINNTGNALDNEGDTVNFVVHYSYGGFHGSSAPRLVGSSFDLFDELLSNPGIKSIYDELELSNPGINSTFDGEIEITSIEIRESNGDWSYTEFLGDSDYEMSVYIDSSAPYEYGLPDLPGFSLYRDREGQEGMLWSINSSVGTNSQIIGASNFKFQDGMSGIVSYLFWSTDGNTDVSIPVNYSTVSFSDYSGGDIDLSSFNAPVLLKVNRGEPLDAQFVRFSLPAPSEPNPQEGEERWLHVAVADFAGNQKISSSVANLDVVPPEWPIGISGYSFHENQDGGGYFFSLERSAVSDAQSYITEFTSELGTFPSIMVLSGGPSISRFLVDVPKDERISLTMFCADAAGNVSPPAIYSVSSPPEQRYIESVRVEHEEDYTKTLVIVADDYPQQGVVEGMLTDEAGIPTELLNLNITAADNKPEIVIGTFPPRSTVHLAFSIKSLPPVLTDDSNQVIDGDWYKESSKTFFDVDLSNINYDADSISLATSSSMSGRLSVQIHNVSPSLVELVRPDNASYVQSRDIPLGWHAAVDPDGDSVVYVVKVGSGGSGSSLVPLIFSDGLGGTVEELSVTDVSLNQAVNAPNWNHGTTYEWQVAAREYVDVTDDGMDNPVFESEIVSQVSEFTIDDVAPLLIFPDWGNSTFINHDVLNLEIVEDGSGLSSGSVGTMIEMSVDAESYGEFEASYEGLNDEGLRYSVSLPLESGVHSYSIYAADVAGNIVEETQMFRVDTTPPTVQQVELMLPENNGQFVSLQNIFTGDITFDENLSGVRGMYYGWINDISAEPSRGEFISLSHEVNPQGQSGLVEYESVTLEWKGGDGVSQYLWIQGVDWAGNEMMEPYVLDTSIYVDTGFPMVNIEWLGFNTSGGRQYLTALTDLSAEVFIEDPAADEFTIMYGLQDISLSTNEWYDDIETMHSTGNPSSGGEYRGALRIENVVGASREYFSPPFLFDEVPPGDLSISYSPDELVGPGTPIIATLMAVERDSGIDSFRVGLGTAEGIRDVSSQIDGNSEGWLTVNGGNSAVIRFSIPSGTVGEVYSSIEARDKAGLTSQVETGLPSIIVDPRIAGIFVSDESEWIGNAAAIKAYWGASRYPTIESWEYRLFQDDVLIRDWTSTLLQSASIDLSESAVDGATYYWEVRGIFPDDTWTETARSPGAVLDLNAPLFTNDLDSLTPRYTRSDDFRVSWDIDESGSGIAEVEGLFQVFAEGDGESQLVPVGDWFSLAHGSDALIGENYALSLPDGVTSPFYLTLRVRDRAGHQSEIMGEAVFIDDMPPPAPLVVDQGTYLNTKYAPIFHWIWSTPDQGSPLSYEWTLLDTPSIGDGAVWNWNEGDRIVDFAEELYDPEYFQHGQTWYLAVRATDGAGNTSTGISNGIIMDSTAPLLASIDILDKGGTSARYLDSLDELAIFIEADDDLGVGALARYEFTSGRMGEGGVFVPLGETIAGDNNFSDFLIDPNTEVAPGTVLLAQGRAENAAGLKAEGFSIGSLYDTHYPAINKVSAWNSGSGLLFDWSATTSGAPIATYKVALISSSMSIPAPEDWIDIGNRQSISYSRDEIPYETGGVRLFVQAVSESGHASRQDKWGISPVITWDSGPPEITGFTYDLFTANTLSFAISAVDDSHRIAEYQYSIGTQDDGDAFTGGWISEFFSAGYYSKEVVYADLQRSLPSHGALIFLQVRAKDAAGNWSDIASSGPIVADRSAPQDLSIEKGEWNNSRTTVNGLNISATDEESGIIAYRWDTVLANAQLDEIGTSPVVYVSAGEDAEMILSDVELGVESLDEDGRYQLALQVQNGSHLWSPVAYSPVFTVDSILPRILFEHADEQIVSNTNSFTVEFNASEDMESVRFELLRPDGSLPEFSLKNLSAGENSIVLNESLYGTYILRAYPQDYAGNEGTGVAKQEIRVNSPPIIPSENYTTTPNQSLVLDKHTAHDPDGDYPLTYEWDFGDGTLSTQKTPTHRYLHANNGASSSIYTAILTVTDRYGLWASREIKVFVNNTQSGELYTDEYWSGIHSLSGSVWVPPGRTLTLADNTIVKILSPRDSTPIEILVSGSLIAEGSTTFEPQLANGEYWGGIKIEGDASLDGVTIRRAQRGLTITSSSPHSIENANFEDNIIGVHAYGSTLTIDNSQFRNNRAYGIKEDEDSEVTVKNTSFSGNTAIYYHQEQTVLSIEELNALNANQDNTQEIQ